MAKKSKCPECGNGEKWAVPYADFLSLLLALFIALYALASINVEKQKALKEEFMKIYNYSAADTIEEQDKLEKSMTDEPTDDLEEGKKSMGKPLSKLNELENRTAKGAKLIELSEGTFMSVPAHLIFEPGRAEITETNSEDFLKKLAQIISAMPNDTEINVKGFAEESEVNKSRYKDALELSTARANNVIRELLKYNIPSDRLFSSGFGSNKANNLKDKRVVIFELQTMQKVDEKDVDLETIFKNMKDGQQ